MARGIYKLVKGIYKRGKIYWICYAGPEGKIIRESSESTRFDDAEEMLRDKKTAIRKGNQFETKRIENHSFMELAQEYSKWAERQRSYKSKRLLMLQLVDKFGNLKLREFNTLLIEQFQSERMQKGRKDKANKPATINRFIATIKHMFTKAVEWEMVSDEVLKRVRKVKLLEENNRRLRYLSKEECQELINSCDPHLRPIVVTALNTGMRKQEILGLRWEQVDLKNGFILLDTSKNGDRKETPINITLRSTLQGITRRLDVPYLFFDPKTGQRYQSVKKSFATACRNAKITNFTFHDLRHCFASFLIMAGIDLTTVKELLGHKDIKMTLRYAHLAPTHKVKAVDVLNSILTKRPTAHLLHNFRTLPDNESAEKCYNV